MVSGGMVGMRKGMALCMEFMEFEGSEWQGVGFVSSVWGHVRKCSGATAQSSAGDTTNQNDDLILHAASGGCAISVLI